MLPPLRLSTGQRARPGRIAFVVAALPGVNLAELRRELGEMHSRLQNARATAGTGIDVYNAYIRWVNEAVEHLVRIVPTKTLDHLVLTTRYWSLQAQPDTATLQPVQQLLNVELAERDRAFAAAGADVDAEIRRWNQSPGMLTVLDTSFYITHPEKLEEADLAPLLGLRDQPIRLVVPILVVDELDGLKRAGGSQTRWRAAYSLAVIDRVLKVCSGPAMLRPADFSALALDTGEIPRGEVSLEVLFDPPGHSRLPIADDEIVARALAVQGSAGRSVQFVTYDTAQSFRARQTGLEVVKLDAPLPAN